MQVLQLNPIKMNMIMIEKTKQMAKETVFSQLEVKTKTIRRKLIELKLIDPQTSDASFQGKIHRMKQEQKMTATNTSLNEFSTL